MSTVLLPALSVCSLISLSASSCVQASPAGPSCYHGDESRHRLSAVISCMRPTGIFLDSPLVIICVLSFYSLHPSKLCTLPDLFSSIVSPSRLSSVHFPPAPMLYILPSSPPETNLLLKKATATRSHYRHSGCSYNQYVPLLALLNNPLF